MDKEKLKQQKIINETTNSISKLLSASYTRVHNSLAADAREDAYEALEILRAYHNKARADILAHFQKKEETKND